MKTSTMRGPGKEYSHIFERSSKGRVGKSGKLVGASAIAVDIKLRSLLLSLVVRFNL